MFRSAAAALALVLVTAPLASAAPSIDPAAMPAGTYVLDKTHASLIAKVRHMGLSDFTMRFTDVDATYSWDPKSPQTAEVKATIAAASLDTGFPATNAQFAEEFLAASKHPTITFVSTSIRPTTAGKGTMTGDLTLRGVTKPVTLDVTYNGFEAGERGSKSGFSANTTIKRSEWGSTFLVGPMLADDVEIVLELEFAKK